MWDYTDKVKDHFMHPRNVGDIKNPDAEAEVGNINCGDVLKLMLKIDKKTGKITDAKFKTFGCGSAIASSSALTELIIGKTIDEARKITNQQIADFLGGLPREKMHCSVMGMEALQEAIAKYKGEDLKTPDMEEREICHCFQVTEKEIRDVVKKNKLTTLEDVTNFTKAGGACGQCHKEIQNILDEILHVRTKSEGKESKLTNLQKIKLIETVIEEDIRPALQRDGGDIELVDIEHNKVIIKFTGACSMCASRGSTMINFVEKTLKEKVGKEIFLVLQIQ